MALSDDRLSPLTLGTTTLGMAYGVANPADGLDAADAAALLDVAWDGGIRTVDTAPGYGAAESRLGTWMASTGRTPSIVSKLPALGGIGDGDVRAAVRAAARRSAGRLGVDRLDGYLAHDAADYARPAVREAFAELKGEGVIRAAGVSVYESASVFTALAAGPPDIVQVPLNVLDRRMLTSGAIAACGAAGVGVFVRSVFLQGALLMPPGDLPPPLYGLAPAVRGLRRLAQQAGMSVAGLALRWACSVPDVRSVIVGAYGVPQLRELLGAAKGPPLDAEMERALAALAASAPAGCLDPRTWNR